MTTPTCISLCWIWCIPSVFSPFTLTPLAVTGQPNYLNPRKAIFSSTPAIPPLWDTHCERGSRHACQLPHSDTFPSWSWTCILRFTFLFIFLWISHINKLLNFLYINPKLQVDCHHTPVCSQMHSTPQLPKFTIHQASSRFVYLTQFTSRIKISTTSPSYG